MGGGGETLHAAQKGLSITSRVKRKSLLQIMNMKPFCDTTHGNSSLSFNITNETNTYSFLMSVRTQLMICFHTTLYSLLKN